MVSEETSVSTPQLLLHARCQLSIFELRGFILVLIVLVPTLVVDREAASDIDTGRYRNLP